MYEFCLTVCHYCENGTQIVVIKLAIVMALSAGNLIESRLLNNSSVSQVSMKPFCLVVINTKYNKKYV